MDTMNRSKAKGTAAETAVVRYLRTNGFVFADRQPLRGGRDQGDITACPGVIIEVKNHATPPSGLPTSHQLTTWQEQTQLEADNAGKGTIGILVVKRSGTTDPGRWNAWVRLRDITACDRPDLAALWVMAPLGHLVDVLRCAGYGDPIDAADRMDQGSPAATTGSADPAPATEPELPGPSFTLSGCCAKHGPYMYFCVECHEAWQPLQEAGA